MKKTRDIRVVRTQTALLEALEELLKTKKLSTITITDLCQQAKINRNTFYYHYNNIYEFLNDHKRIVTEELNDISEESKTHKRDNLVEIFKTLKLHPHFLNILISPNCDLDFFNDIFNAASEKAAIVLMNNNDKEKLTAKERLLLTYCNAGSNAVIISWITNGMKESPEAITDIIWESSKSGVLSLIFPGEKFD